MPRFAANLGFLFPEHPFPERFGAAAAAGFGAVEFAQPYPYDARELAETGCDNAGLQYDIYHAAMMGDDPVAGLAQFAPVIRHVQFADAPGRHEPGTGGVDIAGCFARLDALGYEGWTAAEYRPSKPTVETLGWFA